MSADSLLMPAGAVREHTDLPALRAALADRDLWLALPTATAAAALPQGLRARLTLHRFQGRGCLTVDSLSPADLAPLAAATAHVFINRASIIAPAFPAGDLPSQLMLAGFQTYTFGDQPALADPSGRRPARIGAVEFLLSTANRLARYPRLNAGGLRSDYPTAGDRPRLVVLLDLIQDFEVLRPLLVTAAGASSPFDVTVAVSERVLGSAVWPNIAALLNVLEVPHFKPIGPVDVVNALGRNKSLLLTSSESSAAGHVFAHTACRIAPARAMKVTVQHGYECVGLRHHRAHDLDFPVGVHFASDLVLTWDHADALASLAGSEAGKCIPVGIVKAISERAAHLADARWREGWPPLAGAQGGTRKLLIAENLHSVRFKAPTRYRRFLDFILTAERSPDVELTVRSHPGKRTLEKDSKANNLKFLEGLLRADDLLGYRSLVSPPSTVVLDSVLAGVPTAVWADACDAGDVANYQGLPVVADFDDWDQWTRGSADAPGSQSLRWAIDSSAALNGIPAAWNTLVQLFH